MDEQSHKRFMAMAKELTIRQIVLEQGSAYLLRDKKLKAWVTAHVGLYLGSPAVCTILDTRYPDKKMLRLDPPLWGRLDYVRFWPWPKGLRPVETTLKPINMENPKIYGGDWYPGVDYVGPEGNIHMLGRIGFVNAVEGDKQ